MSNKSVSYLASAISLIVFILFLPVLPFRILIKYSRWGWLKTSLIIVASVLIFSALEIFFLSLGKNDFKEMQAAGLTWSGTNEDGDFYEQSAGNLALEILSFVLSISTTALLLGSGDKLLPYKLISRAKATSLSNEIIKAEDEELNHVDNLFQRTSLWDIDSKGYWLQGVILVFPVMLFTYFFPVLFTQKPSICWIDKLTRFLNFELMYSTVAISVTLLYYGFAFGIWAKVAKPITRILTKSYLDSIKSK